MHDASVSTRASVLRTPACFKLSLLGGEGDMAVLLQVFRIDYHAVILHSALVKHLRQQDIQFAELGMHLREVDAPLDDVLAGHDNFGLLHLVEKAR